jgi:hypothetical protein
MAFQPSQAVVPLFRTFISRNKLPVHIGKTGMQRVLHLLNFNIEPSLVVNFSVDQRNMNKKSLTELDIRTQFILPALVVKRGEAK